MSTRGILWVTVAIPVCLALLLSGCPTDTNTPPPVQQIVKGTIKGVVIDSDTGDPINGASVVTAPETSQESTGSKGKFRFEELPIGVYQVMVTATGYLPQEVSGVSVTAGQTVEVEVQMDLPPVTTASVSGMVMKHDSPSDAPLAGATVALVDAMALASSGGKTPLETLAAASPYTAVTDVNGEYTIDGVAPSSYFVHAAPAVADQETILPGGDRSRESFDVELDAKLSVNIVLSQQPSAAATYVGSGTCLFCHDGTAATDVSGYKKTLHALVYRVPDQTSSIQDLSDLPNANAAHAYFKDGNSRDNTGAGDEYGLRINSTDFPLFTATNAADRYNIWLGYESAGGKYFMQMSNTADTIMSAKYYVEFTWGGMGIYKERWVTRAKADSTYDADPAGGDSSYYILPVQYDEKLQAGAEPFHPYNYTNWGPPTVDGGPARAPAKNKSFDLNCAGCHFTGNTLVRDVNGLYHADALNASSSAGIIDFDGDGHKDEMVIGCEGCHGPGSEHVQAGLPPRVVLSRYLSAERDAMLCGRCHTRGAGKATFTGTTDHPEYPAAGTDTISFPRPGIGYEEFVGTYHTDNPGIFADDVGHSRQHHQQFVDMQKSKHYKNQYLLVGCSECHELHNRDIGPSLSARDDNNQLCLSCHSLYDFGLQPGYTIGQEADAVSDHMIEFAGMASGYDPQNLSGFASETADGGPGKCSSCHMPKTAASQSRWIHETVNSQGQPAGGRIRGDVASHVFDVVTPAESQALYNSVTTNRQLANSCSACHNSITDDLDYAY
ncbi:MAG: carboxypeptidase regulatory-like domain-containing protein [Candidatus Hydrogenedentes bacterium]|nr:carboxypeptidase regulatory-like domain-containing protein [Candidatus Hydrogenedentota bacterium]